MYFYRLIKGKHNNFIKERFSDYYKIEYKYVTNTIMF